MERAIAAGTGGNSETCLLGFKVHGFTTQFEHNHF
jgi:hypothetical protein